VGRDDGDGIGGQGQGGKVTVVLYSPHATGAAVSIQAGQQQAGQHQAGSNIDRGQYVPIDAVVVGQDGEGG
jgi:hypothetical protein